jgi:Fur family peroxide stress response transcriptional regulator
MNKNTKQRELILRIIRMTCTHPTAEWILAEAKTQIPRISKATVYRNLQVLAHQGLISPLNLDGTVCRYEVKQPGHYHFRCERCNAVVDLSLEVDVSLNKKVAEQTGFNISSHQLEFRGLCRKCMESKGETMAVKQAGERYRCETCGNEIVVTKAGGGTLVCCGSDMKKIE